VLANKNQQLDLQARRREGAADAALAARGAEEGAAGAPAAAAAVLGADMMIFDDIQKTRKILRGESFIYTTRSSPAHEPAYSEDPKVYCRYCSTIPTTIAIVY
jgi:hypothetical protein